jgi:hypothetical protein
MLKQHMEWFFEGLTSSEMVIPYISASSACQISSQKDTWAVTGGPWPAGSAFDSCKPVVAARPIAGGRQSKMQSVHHNKVEKGFHLVASQKFVPTVTLPGSLTLAAAASASEPGIFSAKHQTLPAVVGWVSFPYRYENSLTCRSCITVCLEPCLDRGSPLR